MLEWMWDERYWFPANMNVTWKDMENVPGDPHYLPDIRDLHWAFFLGLVLLAVRFLMERYVVVPVCRRLGVSESKSKINARSHPILEQAHATSGSTLNHTDIQALSKQTDLSVRQIERWMRKRKQQDYSSKLKKISDCSWHFIFYGTASIYGLFVLWDKPWLWDTIHCWRSWPKIYIGSDIYWYYMLELGFYWSLVFSLCTDHKRKDFKEMIIHHVATMILMYFSWTCNFVTAGTLVLLVHDVADPWLALAKICRYTGFPKATDACFVVFLIVWILSRLIIYPFVVIHATLVVPFVEVIDEPFFAYYFMNFFLFLLMVLHLLWSYSIGRIVVEKLRSGKTEDVRSDSDETADASSDSDDMTVPQNGHAVDSDNNISKTTNGTDINR